MSTLTIRPPRLEDAPLLADYNAAMAMETENLTLDRSTLLEGVRAAITDPSKARYFLAEIDGQVVGQLMVTWEWSDWRNGWIWWVQSVYVHPDHRRRGVFRALWSHLEQIARDERASLVRLYVERHNVSAQQTYQSLGLVDSGYLVMEKPLSRSSPPTTDRGR